MGAKTKSILFQLVVLCLASGLSQRASAGTEPLQAVTPSTEEILETVKQNLCAPTIDPKKKLEATACVDCAKESVTQSTGLGGTVDKVRSLFAPLKVEEEKTQIKRDLAFFKSKFAKQFMGEDSDSDSTTEEQLADAKSRLERYLKKKKEQIEAQNLLERTIAAFKNAEKGHQLSDSEKALISEIFKAEIEENEGLIENYKTVIEDSTKALEKKKGDSSSHVSVIDTYKEKSASLTAESELKKKALAWSKDKDVLELYGKLLLSLTNSQSPFDQTQINKQISELQSSIGILEKKLAQETALKQKSLEASELSKIEERLLHRLTSMLENQNFKACGMSVAEATAILHYTGSGFLQLNKALRSGGQDAEEMKSVVEVLNSALQRLNRYNGPVRRGTNLPKEAVEEYQVGKVILAPAYSSTSLTGGNFGNARFIIHTKTGRFVGAHSRYPSENEVLIAAGAKFKVIDRKEFGAGVEIVLDEIDP